MDISSAVDTRVETEEESPEVEGGTAEAEVPNTENLEDEAATALEIDLPVTTDFEYLKLFSYSLNTLKTVLKIVALRIKLH